ncbi:MAG: hypothetical protein GX139_07640 [Armatimonadetes bacterium]|jgi:hypothetical protein|nr:hypothetical protein [Armatimonadota bacterium]
MKKTNTAKCSHMQHDALAMLGIELTDDEEADLFSHLAACPACRGEFRRDRNIWRAMGACPVVTAEPSFSRMLSLRLSLEESAEIEAAHIDRVLPDLEAEVSGADAHYDLSSLASIFASEMPQ